ncbi:unnamed protein product [Closterium sp. NIES-53]
MFQHIKDLVELDDSGPKAWKLLRDVIQPNTQPMVIVLEKELAALSMRPGDDVKPVLDKIKDTYVRMAAAGSNVSQMKQCTKIISVLDNSWNNLIPTLNTQQDQWTPEWLRQQILQEDFRRRHTGGGAANKTAEGYGAAGGSRGKGGGRSRGRGRGFGKGRGQGDYNEGHGSSGGRGSTRMEGALVGILTWYQSEGLGFESRCMHMLAVATVLSPGPPSVGGGWDSDRACWYCKKAGHPWFKCFSRPEGWAPPGMKPPSGERPRDGVVQGSGAQGDGAHGKADPGMFLMVEDVKGSEGDVGLVGKVVMHPLTHWVIDSGCTSHMTPWADLLDEVKPPGKIMFVAAASGALLPVIVVGNAKLVKDGSLKGLEMKGAAKDVGSCPTCLETKFTKLPFSSGTRSAKALLALVHMDVVGPMRAPSLSGRRYFLTIVDDHTRAVWMYPLKTKGEEAATVVKEWMPRAQRESGHKVKVIRTDNGGELIGADFEAVLEKKGIQHLLTVPYNPQQNGVAERFNRTLQEGARTLLGRAGLPDPFWTKWYGSAPAVNMLRAYDCMVVFHVPKEKRGNLEASGRWGVHLGLAKDHKGWLIWDLTSQQLTVSRDVKFLESLYYKEWKQQQQKLPTTPLIIEADEVQRPSRQVQVTLSDEEISGVTEDRGELERIKQMDITTAFLNGIILEELYMMQPEGLDDGSGRVCRLKKAIYGLKQAPGAWYHKLEETLLAGGFKKSECDDKLFLLQEKEQFLMLLVYVDDILLFSESAAMIERMEEMLEMQFMLVQPYGLHSACCPCACMRVCMECFETLRGWGQCGTVPHHCTSALGCSKMGDVKYYLGMHVERDLDKGVLRLHLRKYGEGLAEMHGLQDGGNPATPQPSGFTVEPCADEEVVGESDMKLFHSIVGALNYAPNHTRSDIAFATSTLASVVSHPSHEQLEAAKRMVRYMSATASVGLEYSAVRQRQQRGAADLGKGEMLLTCYSDVSFNSI